MPEYEETRVRSEEVAGETKAAPPKMEPVQRESSGERARESGGERVAEHFAAVEVEAWREEGRKEARRVIETAKIQALEQLESEQASTTSRGTAREEAAAEVKRDAAPQGHRTNIMACPLSVGQAEATGVCMLHRPGD